jgi:hypothetical protein
MPVYDHSDLRRPLGNGMSNGWGNQLEIALVLVRLDHLARIVNANHVIVCTAVVLRVFPNVLPFSRLWRMAILTLSLRLSCCQLRLLSKPKCSAEARGSGRCRQRQVLVGPFSLLIL